MSFETQTNVDKSIASPHSGRFCNALGFQRSSHLNDAKEKNTPTHGWVQIFFHDVRKRSADHLVKGPEEVLSGESVVSFSIASFQSCLVSGPLKQKI